MVETNYTDYALVLKHRVFNREYTQVALYGETQTSTHSNISTFHQYCSSLSLYLFAGRAQRVRNDVIQKFKAFALSQGLSRESILTPPPAGRFRRTCAPPHVFLQYTENIQAHTGNDEN